MSITKRIQIETLLKHKIPVKEIAESIGVHVSTIYRELKCGTYEKKVRKHDYYERAYKTVEAYSPDIAQEKKGRQYITVILIAVSSMEQTNE